MNVEFTGRQYDITPTIRKSVESGLTKIRKILGDKFDGKVILAIEKHRHKAEITINPRNGPLVGEAQAGDMKTAVNEALDHLERSLRQHSSIPGPHRLRAACLSQLGRMEEARAALDEFLRIVPNATIASMRAQLPLKHAEDFERYASALRQAGLPE